MGGLLLLLLEEEELFLLESLEDLFFVVESVAQAEHFLLRVFVLVALDALLFLVSVSLLLGVGNLLLQ